MNDVRARLQLPAIALIIVGTLNALSGLVLILGRVVSVVKGRDPVITDEDRRLGYMFAGIFFPIVSLISIAAAPVIIFGGVQMLKQRRYCRGLGSHTCPDPANLRLLHSGNSNRNLGAYCPSPSRSEGRLRRLSNARARTTLELVTKQQTAALSCVLYWKVSCCEMGLCNPISIRRPSAAAEAHHR